MKINSLGQLKDSIDRILGVVGIDASERIGETIKLAMVGATSVGKSKTINAILGREVCSVGHVGNTTKEAYWVPFHLSKSKQPDFFLLDLPGWGVSKRVDREYRTILSENLPQANAVLWIIRADALGTLAYDTQWIEEIVLPSLGNDISKLILGVNQIENVYDKVFDNGKPSKILINTLNEKCKLIYDEVSYSIPDFQFEQIQPYSAALEHRVLPLVNALVLASGEKGWILQLISNVSKENDTFYK